MITEERARILSNFFLDGAKIIFGSLVIGVFAPGMKLVGSNFWITLSWGVVVTVAFLTVAVLLKTYKSKNQNAKSA